MSLRKCMIKIFIHQVILLSKRNATITVTVLSKNSPHNCPSEKNLCDSYLYNYNAWNMIFVIQV